MNKSSTTAMGAATEAAGVGAAERELEPASTLGLEVGSDCGGC